jgi:hypothetical protein
MFRRIWDEPGIWKNAMPRGTLSMIGKGDPKQAENKLIQVPCAQGTEIV